MFFCVCQVCLIRNAFLCVSGMFEKHFFMRVKGMLEKIFLRVSGMFEKKCSFFCMCPVCLKRNVYFQCVRYA